MRAMGYVTATGQIRGQLHGPDEESIMVNVPAGYDWIEMIDDEGYDADEFWVDINNSNAITAKMLMSLTGDTSVAVGELGTINNIPADTTVIWPDGWESIETGTLEYSMNVDGEYTFRFQSAPYITEEMIINVTS